MVAIMGINRYRLSSAEKFHKIFSKSQLIIVCFSGEDFKKIPVRLKILTREENPENSEQGRLTGPRFDGQSRDVISCQAL